MRAMTIRRVEHIVPPEEPVSEAQRALNEDLRARALQGTFTLSTREPEHDQINADIRRKLGRTDRST